MITLKVIALSDRFKVLKFEKEKYFVRKYSLSSLRKAGAPDGVEAPVGEVVHEVDVEDEAEAQVDVVNHDVHVDCYDLPMSIYSQYFSSLL